MLWFRILPGVGCFGRLPMLEELEESGGPDLGRLCQVVSPNHDPATAHCPTFRRWFCDACCSLSVRQAR